MNPEDMQQINPEDWHNDAVLEALEAFRQEQDGAHEQAFIQALLNAVFIAPVNFSKEPVMQEDGSVNIPDDAEIRLVVLEQQDGKTAFPIFTDLEALNAGDLQSEDNLYSYPMTIQNYLPMLEQIPEDENAGLALNPFSNGMPITRENLTFIKSLLDSQSEGASQTAAQASEDADLEVTDTEESEIPTPLLSELVGIADESFGDVDTIYLLWLNNKTATVANYLLVVDGAEEDKVKGLFPKFAEAFSTKAEPDKAAVDIIWGHDFDIDMSDFKPIYTRNI